MWFRNALLMFICLALFSGCSSISSGRFQKLSAEDLEKIRVGVTTKQDILRTYGQPDTRMIKPNGIESYIYKRSVRRSLTTPFIIVLGRSSTEGESLKLVFKNNKVVDYEYKVDQGAITH